MFSRAYLSAQGLLAVVWVFINHFLPSVSKYVKDLGTFQSLFQDLTLNLRTDLSHQVIIITGSNTGIGKQSARHLAELGATVVLACRDEVKGTTASSEINEYLRQAIGRGTLTAGNGKAVFMKLDLTDLYSVLSFAEAFKSKFGRLDILINNAGMNTEGLLINGLQQLFQVNYLGHYLLVRCLEDLLRCKKTTRLGEYGSSSGRVINLSSVMHHTGQPNFKVSALRMLDRLLRTKFSYYDDSKMYMNLLTLEINRRFGASQSFEGDSPSDKSTRPVFAISVNPGAVSSDIWRNVPFQTLWKSITGLVFLDTEQGSATTVSAACIDEPSLSNYRQRFSTPVPASSYTTGEMCVRSNVPYLVPYYMPTPTLAYELLGPFAGPRWSAVSLPAHSCSSHVFQFNRHQDHDTLHIEFSSPEDLSAQLWDYSGQLCERILLQSGVASSRLEFLR